MSTSNSIKQAAEAARGKTTEAMEATKAFADSAKADQIAVKNDFLHTPFMRAALPFINGGAAGMVATTVIQPIDMIKVRLQLAGEGVKTGPKPSPLSVTREIIAAGKVMDLYTGLSAGLLRQAVYTTARLGFFDTFMKKLTVRAKDKGTQIGFSERAAAGLSAGGLAAMIGNPADLALIRMQSDGLKPLAERKNYSRFAKHCKIRRSWCALGWCGSHSSSSNGSELWPVGILLRSQTKIEGYKYEFEGSDFECQRNCRVLCEFFQFAL
jgi:solute carrier family 25 oxoglutarate transporter 11